eukprot:5275566-Amphidinium_carterae.1
MSIQTHKLRALPDCRWSSMCRFCHMHLRALENDREHCNCEVGLSCARPGCCGSHGCDGLMRELAGDGCEML